MQHLDLFSRFLTTQFATSIPGRSHFIFEQLNRLFLCYLQGYSHYFGCVLYGL